MITFSNASNRGRVCLYSQSEGRFKSYNMCSSSQFNKFYVSMPAAASRKETMVTFTHNLPLCSLR